MTLQPFLSLPEGLLLPYWSIHGTVVTATKEKNCDLSKKKLQ